MKRTGMALVIGTVLLLAGCREQPESAYPEAALEACADMSVSEWTQGPGYTPVDCDDIRIEQGWEGGA